MSYSYAITSADFNLDGALDIAFCVDSSFGPSIGVLFNNGKGTFAAPQYFGSSLGYQFCLVARDFNNDGRPDLAFTSEYTNKLAILLNSGTGQFPTQTTYATGTAPREIAVGDVNADGKLDIFVANSNTGSVSYFRNTGSGSFAARVDTANVGASMALADFINDQKLELAAVQRNHLYIWPVNTNGTLGYPDLHLLAHDGISIKAADLDGDGKTDLAVVGNGIQVLRGNGSGGFAAIEDYNGGGSRRIAVVADLNADGKPDIAGAFTGRNGNIHVRLNIRPPRANSSNFDFDHGPQSLRFRFDADVRAKLSSASLQVVSVPGNLPIPVQSYSYDSATNTASFTLPSPMPDGNYRATLPGAVVVDPNGRQMESDATLDFFALGGDANHDRKVDITDLYALASNWLGRGKTFSQGDFNFDTRVDSADLGILSAHWQSSLPAAPPLQQALGFAPTRKATRIAIDTLS